MGKGLATIGLMLALGGAATCFNPRLTYVHTLEKESCCRVAKFTEQSFPILPEVTRTRTEDGGGYHDELQFYTSKNFDPGQKLNQVNTINSRISWEAVDEDMDGHVDKIDLTYNSTVKFLEDGYSRTGRTYTREHDYQTKKIYFDKADAMLAKANKTFLPALHAAQAKYSTWERMPEGLNQYRPRSACPNE